MVRKLLAVVIVLALLPAAFNPVLAQEAEIVVGEISIPSLRWGPQVATFDVTNATDYYKTISVKTEIVFEGTYLNPVRVVRTNYFLDPETTIVLNQLVDIPGNYGKAKLTVGVYDVVDTLDPLLDYQLAYEQPFMLNYHIPDEVLPYFDEGITLPPMVDNGLDFDSEFSRLLPFFLSEGKDPNEIAELCKCDKEFVMHVLKDLTAKGYLSNNLGDFTLRFPAITTKEAEEGKALADEMAVKLADLVVKNLPGFKKTMDSMVTAGSLPADSDDFVHGGSVLYYTYPTVAALFFWYDLGQEYIIPGRPLNVFHRTDLCNARTHQFMYAVQGGDYFNGTNFYHLELSSRNLEITYGDSIPVIECFAGFENQRHLVQDMHWKWGEGYSPEPFVIDTGVVHAALRGLRPGAEDLLSQIKNSHKLISDKFGHSEFMVGARYWLWNLITSRALDILRDRGVITRHGNGHYRFEELS